jgi:hypothetical protein
MAFDAVRSVAVSLERQSPFSAVVGRHTAGVASRILTKTKNFYSKRKTVTPGALRRFKTNGKSSLLGVFGVRPAGPPVRGFGGLSVGYGGCDGAVGGGGRTANTGSFPGRRKNVHR